MKAVIFDMDGVMISSEEIYFESESRMCKKRGKVLTLETTKEVMGRSGIDSMKILKEKMGFSDTPKQLLKERDEIYMKLAEKKLEPMPGFLALLGKVKAKKAVASSARRKRIEFNLKKIKLNHKFDAIVSADDVEKSKPDPSIFLLAASRLKEKPENCIVIEDSQNGVLAAKAAGMLCIAVRHKFNTNQDFSLADIVVNSLKEIRQDMLE